MGYTPKYLCRELCNSTNATMHSFYDTDRIDDLITYSFLFAKACYVSINTPSDIVNEVVFEMYCDDTIAIQIDALAEKICGYINNEQIYAVDIHPDISATLFEMGIKYYNFLIGKKELTVVDERPGIEITYDLLA